MKKLLVILGMITCMVGLCACGEEETLNPSVNAEEVLFNADATVKTIHMIVSLNAGMIDQYAAEDPVGYAGLLSWQSALEDIGEFVDTDGGTIVAKGDEIIVNINVLGTKHNAKVEFVFNDTAALCTSITTNVEYSFKELMSKAVLNTVIGMGTVFVVLIIISLIISCFGLLSKVNTGKQKKAVETTAEKATADPVVEQIAQKEELAGDAELVAVIAAAIAAYEGSGSTDGFVVRSIRKSNKSKWQNA